MNAGYTPMIEQYREIKRRHANEILFFRLGDFYEMFFDDAETASRELEITLTSRDGGANIRVPMCGVPYHAAENYIAKLIAKGYKVAICEQVEDPKQAKGIVRREVIKIITPGTILSETMLSERGNNFLAVLYEDKTLALAAADISTGDCIWSEFFGPSRLNSVCDLLFRLAPAELILAGKIDAHETLDKFIASRLPGCLFSTQTIDDFKAIAPLPLQHFPQSELPDSQTAMVAVACLLRYLHETVKGSLSHLNKLVEYKAKDHLVIDAATLRNLEVTRNIRDGGKKGTLLSVIDFTQTAMGGRLLKTWLENPLVDPAQIIERQDAVEELVNNPALRMRLQESLENIYDFERILTRVEIGTANARDLAALNASLAVLPEIKNMLLQCNAHILSSACHSLNSHVDIVNLINAAIVDNPPFSVREGGLIKAGYDMELDELRTLAKDSRQWIQDLETKEREATGIKSLKIGYNKVFGYYIEVTHANADAVPPHYVRKQTLANAERYITPELKEFEIKILGAQEKIVNIEYRLFSAVRDYVKGYLKEIQETARYVAQIDVIVSLSEASSRYNYVRPEINRKREIIIKDGRHPVVERLLQGEMFVPNDIVLNHTGNEILVITGPNMAGKSTYMRQIALLVLLAQVGCFIPARQASICPVDSIFSRVGASDDLATGQSTFMVEMNEVAHILKNATHNSLIILDEIGRGTSTYDGMSIARSVIEYINDKIKAKTLIATHYHELTDLADRHPNIKNFSVAVKERGSEVIFLRRIVPGGADKSYGIHVAQLAGLPKKVVARAQELLKEMENLHQAEGAPREISQNRQPLSLFASSLIDDLISLDVMTMTPIEALNILYKLQIQARREAGLQ